MLPEKRRQEILRLNKEKQGISIKDLVDFLKVSNMTILRDIKLLEKKGKIEVVRGGIIPVETEMNGYDLSHDMYDKKRKKSLLEKQQIGKYCADHFIKEGSTIALEGGSTSASIIGFLANKKKITLITNGLFTLTEASEKLNSSCRIIGSGGLLERPYLLFLGPDVVQFFHERHTEVAFVSCVGFDMEVGPMDSHPLEVQAKRAIFTNAARRILILDKTKFSVKSVLNSVLVDDITDIVTNASLQPVTVQTLRERFPNIKLHLA